MIPVVTDPEAIGYNDSRYTKIYHAVYDGEGGSLAELRASKDRATARALLVQALADANQKLVAYDRYWAWRAATVDVLNPEEDDTLSVMFDDSRDTILELDGAMTNIPHYARRDALAAKLAALDAS